MRNKVSVRRLLDRWDGYTTEAFWAEVITPLDKRFVIVLQVDADGRGDSIGIFRYEADAPADEPPVVEWFDDLNTDDVFASDLFVQLTGVVPSLHEELGVKTVVTDYRSAGRR